MLAALVAPSLLLLIERRFLRVLRWANFHASMKFARRRIRVNCVKMYGRQASVYGIVERQDRSEVFFLCANFESFQKARARRSDPGRRPHTAV